MRAAARTSVAALAGAGVAALALSAGSSPSEAPRPSIAGVPPSELRFERTLPLDDAAAQELSDFVAGCASSDGAELCEQEPTAAQKCAIERVERAGAGRDARALLDAIAGCGTDDAERRLRLQIYDARIEGSTIPLGAVVEGFVFVPHAAEANAPSRLVVFPEYVPVATE